jgi:hypothetical protein
MIEAAEPYANLFVVKLQTMLRVLIVAPAALGLPTTINDADAAVAKRQYTNYQVNCPNNSALTISCFQSGAECDSERRQTGTWSQDCKNNCECHIE